MKSHRISILKDLQESYGDALHNDLIEANILWKEEKEYFEAVFFDGEYSTTIYRYELKMWFQDDLFTLEIFNKSGLTDMDVDDLKNEEPYSIEDCAGNLIYNLIWNNPDVLKNTTELFRS